MLGSQNQTRNQKVCQLWPGKFPGQKLELRARERDGGARVTVLDGGYEVEGLGSFETKRQLLIALTGKDRHWTFDRYFRLGKHEPEAPRMGEPAFDLMEAWGSDSLPTREKPKASRKVTVSRSKGEASVGAAQVVSEAEGPSLGIDLVNRSDEVAKLLFAGFGQWIYSAGYDPDDVLQEVYKGLITRNRGTCPWDASKSSFGHYVHMVCRNILSNYHRKMKRRGEFEDVGVSGYGASGDWGDMDVGGSQTLSAPASAASEWVGLCEAQEALTVYLEGSEKAHTQDGKMAVVVLPMVAEGLTRAEIAERLGVSPASVSRGLTYLREQAREWASHS